MENEASSIMQLRKSAMQRNADTWREKKKIIIPSEKRRSFFGIPPRRRRIQKCAPGIMQTWKKDMVVQKIEKLNVYLYQGWRPVTPKLMERFFS
jgi:hypothetical protein